MTEFIKAMIEKAGKISEDAGKAKFLYYFPNKHQKYEKHREPVERLLTLDNFDFCIVEIED